MAINLFAFFCIAAVFFLTKSISITIAATIAIILLLKSLVPLIKIILERIFPSISINIIKEQDFKEINHVGMFVLVITQFVSFDCKNEKSIQLYDSIVKNALQQHIQSSPSFSLQYETVCEHKLPTQYAAANSGKHRSGVNRCFHTWLKEIRSKNLITCKKGYNLFLCDTYFVHLSTHERLPALVLFLFNNNLPQ